MPFTNHPVLFFACFQQLNDFLGLSGLAPLLTSNRVKDAASYWRGEKQNMSADEKIRTKPTIIRGKRRTAPTTEHQQLDRTASVLALTIGIEGTFTKDQKASIADYVRLVQFLRDVKADSPREVTVEWMECFAA